MFIIKCRAGEKVNGKELEGARADNSLKSFALKRNREGRLGGAVG